jgi:predicted ATPase
MIRSFKLNKTFRKIDPYSIDFRPGVNIIVGENGSGKSTLLMLLTKKIETGLVSLDHDRDRFRFFDSEKDNPRISNKPLMNDTAVFQIVSHFVSHGETLLPIILAQKDFIQSGEIILVDEPESGISLSNQLKIVDSFNHMAKTNQLIIVTHSYPIIKSQKEVFSLDVKKWVSSEEFLKGI